MKLKPLKEELWGPEGLARTHTGSISRYVQDLVMREISRPLRHSVNYAVRMPIWLKIRETIIRTDNET